VPVTDPRREPDVTDARHLEADARTRLAAVVESSDDAIVTKDLNGIVTSWNRAAERMFGYAASEAIGRSIRIIIPTDRLAEEDETLARVARGEAVDHFETVRRRKDGTLLSISLSISPIRDEAGTVVGASKIARDITEQKRAAERAAFLAEVGSVLASSLDYEATLTAVATLAVPTIADWCAVDVVEPSGEIERLAVAHVDPAKIELAKMVRDRYEDASNPYSVTAVVQTGRPVLLPLITDDMIVAAAKGDRERIRLVRQLGLVSYICVPLVAHARRLGALTLVTSTSRRRYADDDLQFARDVAHRAALAVDNARAYRELQLANRLKDDFLATLSHELRTPLNAILGYSRLLRSGLMADEKRASALDTVHRNATALTQIVEDVLDVSRIVSGKLRLDIQPVDLPRVVRDAVDSMLPAAEAKQLRVQTVLDPSAPPVAGDPDRIQQIVWNLVSNAVKFTPKGGLVQVRVERANSHVEIVVSDTGIGIEPEFLPHIFERFRQADSGPTRQHGGLGLGLAIARHLVELHGGTIHGASGGRDKGSTFRARLPIMIVHAAEPVERRVAAPGRALEGHLVPLDGIHVLAVDDDADALSLAREILEEAGAKVTVTDSAETAVGAIVSAKPDVLIADVGMPELDGYELIRRVRKLPDASMRQIPAAALTAYARAEDRIKSLQAGYQMHMAKPIDPAELVAAVAALARRSMAD
jgi:PAS domain S-box-containing protein